MSRRARAGRAAARGLGLAAICASAMLLLAWVPAAWASDHVSPDAALLTGPFVQAAYHPKSYWVYRENGECEYPPVGSRAPTPFPRALVVPGGRRRVVIRFAKRRRPARVRVRYVGRIDPRSYGFAEPFTEPRVVLAPERRAGRVIAWRATFRLDLRDDRYISVAADWYDEDGCDRRGRPSQEAGWRFHLRARR